jgi:beta-glucanase (GH16 family)
MTPAARIPRTATRTLFVVSLAAVLSLFLSACNEVTGPVGTPGIPTTTTPTAPATTTSTTPGAPAGWRLVGGDEFDGSTLDAAKWSAYHNTYGDGNNELACLTPNNVGESGGALHITAKKQAITCPNAAPDQYSSGFIGSREAGTYYPRYARFEIRARLPHAQGLWPAFWLRHVNGAGSAEVDIMEYFHSQVPGKTTQTLHLDGVSNVDKKTTPFETSTDNPGWHTWTVDILPDPAGVRFTFSTDGKTVNTFVDTKHAWTSADPNQTWDIAVNLAVGGRWTGGPDDALGYLRDLNRCSEGGTAPSGCATTGIRRVDWNNPASSTYDIDYVRVYAPA